MIPRLLSALLLLLTLLAPTVTANAPASGAGEPAAVPKPAPASPPSPEPAPAPIPESAPPADSTPVPMPAETSTMLRAPVQPPEPLLAPSPLPALSSAPSLAVAPAQGQLRAQLRAVRSTVLCSDMSGRIIDLKIREGERFSAGQPLVRFLCATQENALAKAKALEEKRAKLNEINKNLLPLKSVSNLEVEVSAAELAEAQAELRQAKAMVERCQARAPFSGRVAEVLARQDQYVAEGQPLMEILSEDDLELEFLAPSAWLRWLKPGQAFTVAIDELDATFSGKVVRLSARLDPVSQSIKVFGRVDDPARQLLPGMSGRIEMTPQ